MNKDELELALTYEGVTYKVKVDIPKLKYISPADFINHMAFCCNWEVNKSNTTKYNLPGIEDN